MTVAIITIRAVLNPRYPWKPSQGPVADSLENAVSDALQYLEGVDHSRRVEVQVRIKEERG